MLNNLQKQIKFLKTDTLIHLTFNQSEVEKKIYRWKLWVTVDPLCASSLTFIILVNPPVTLCNNAL